ncbi:hypothetical protein NAEGRDRAFT_48963 [Naegleria gruberi]|uniref:Uncharacterized protein n=1 Tax=Naegleria gruberi TaxID=5762 RepID=D2VEU9_NAEGR|nr:uncharacterized protein NAEGRDRAFT_48963 [Naegleria gruberi]EFC44666.1 hypothetical protein NAEGRDRAFT_48963 [Naegleria gruberi]|eukprot:XP_002677410.1 hypothetical protein NAEGRDRAFT_48963 [Naegleria gruberi strain NEG-M]
MLSQPSLSTQTGDNTNDSNNNTIITIEKPRAYQLELLRESIDGNSICILPTGTGKTLLACLLIDQLLHQNDKKEYMGDEYFLSSKCSCCISDQKKPPTNGPPDKKKLTKKIFFLVPTTALRKQQQEAIFKYFYKRECSKMKIKKDFTIDSSKSWNVIVSTPQILLNALQSQIISFEDILLLVFDEAHHATKDHPYVKLMRDYYHNNKPIDPSLLAYNFNFLKDRQPIELPKILGLTATPASQSLYKTSLNEHTLFLRKAKLEFSLDASIKVPYDYMEEMKKHVNNPRQHSVAYSSKSELIEPLNALKTFHSYHNFRDISVDDIEKNYRELGLIGSLIIISLICELDVFESFKSFYPIFNLNQPIEFSSMNEINSSPFISDKVKILFDLVDTYENTNENMRCIIFAERIVHVKAIVKMFRMYRKFIPLNCKELIGSSVMSRQAQATVVKEFSHTTRLLVATKAGEEGLNISKCSLVVQFDICNTTREHIQSMGRARHELSRYVVLYDKDDYSQIIMLTNMGNNERSIIVDTALEELKEYIKSEKVIITNDTQEDIEPLISSIENLSDDEEIEKKDTYIPKPIRYEGPKDNNNVKLFVSQMIINSNGKEEMTALLTFGEIQYPFEVTMHPLWLKLFPCGFITVTKSEYEKLIAFYMRLCRIIYNNYALKDYFYGDGRFYLVLPSCRGNQPRDVIDWNVIYTFEKELSQSEKDYPQSMTILDHLRLGVRVPIDYFIVTTYNKDFYAPNYIDESSTPLESFEKQGSTITYQSYLKDRYEIMCDSNQPMLSAYSLKYHRYVMLIPEFCKPTSLRIDFIESLRAVFKTSNEGTLMSLVEQTLVAHDLKNQMFPSCGYINLSELRNAITHRTSQNLDTNYERYEFFGDTILKYAVVLDIVLRFPFENMKFYNEEKTAKVSNSNLRKLAQKLSIMDFFIETQYYHHNVAGIAFSKSEQEASVKGKKVRADIIESLIGLVGKHSIEEGVKLARDLKLVKKQNFIADKFILNSNPEYVKRIIENTIPDIEKNAKELERIIGYKFKNILYAYYTLIHPSVDIGFNVNYETLEFVGDAVLDLYVSRTMFHNFYLDQSEMHTFRSNFVRNTALEKIAKDFRIDQLLFVKKDLKLKAKSISDVMEALIGAVALDSNLDWDKITDLMELSIFSPKLRDWLEGIETYENEKLLKSPKQELNKVINIKVRLKKYKNKDMFKFCLPVDPLLA